LMGEGLLTEPVSPLRQAQDVARSGDLRRSNHSSLLHPGSL